MYLFYNFFFVTPSSHHEGILRAGLCNTNTTVKRVHAKTKSTSNNNIKERLTDHECLFKGFSVRPDCFYKCISTLIQ